MPIELIIAFVVVAVGTAAYNVIKIFFYRKKLAAIMDGKEKAAPGRRSKNFAQFNGNIDEMNNKIVEILKSKKFVPANYCEERVYMRMCLRGNVPMYIKIESTDGGYNIESFLFYSGLKEEGYERNLKNGSCAILKEATCALIEAIQAG